MSRLGSAVVLLLTWHTPVHAAIFAQAGTTVPYGAYGLGVAATALVLLVVCWPARRQ